MPAPTAGSLMAREMAEQPEVLARLADGREATIASLRGAVPAPRGVVLVARGSSDFAAVFGRYALEAALGVPVALAAPSLATRYGVRMDLGGWLAVGVSQSGATPEIVEVLAAYRDSGAVTVAITNHPEAPLASGADAVLPLHAGDEEAVPATKTFTATVAAFALLAEALGDPPWDGSAWDALPGAVESVLVDGEPAVTAGQGLVGASGLIAVSRGYHYAVALEAALKIKETTSMLALGYSTADFLHGPIAVLERDLPVLTVRADGPAAGDLDALEARVAARGRSLLRIGPADCELPAGAGVAEALSTIPAVVRAQQLARETALALGLDPDQPEGLAKITPTT